MAVVTLNAGNFEKEVIKSEMPVLIDFWASWCMPCRMMAPVFEELSTEVKNIKFAKLSTEDEPEIALKYGISGIPCLLMAKKGKEIGRIVGLAPKDALKAKISQIMG